MTYAETVLADTPRAWYRFPTPSTGSGSPIPNAASPGTRDGEYRTSAIAHSLDGGPLTTEPSAYIGRTTHHTSDGARSGAGAFPGNTASTFEAWLQLPGAPPAVVGAFTINAASSFGFNIYGESDGTLRVRCYTTASPRPSGWTSNTQWVEFFTPAPTLWDGQWHHLAVTLGYGGFVVYLDGQQIGQEGIPATCVNYSGLGGYASGWLFNAVPGIHLAEVAYYVTALPPERIAAHYAAAFPAPEPPEVQGWYASQRVLSSLGLNPDPAGSDQPLFQWHRHDGTGWALDPDRSRALASYSSTYGRQGSVDRVAPTVLTAVLSNRHGAPAAPQLGERFRITLTDKIAGPLGLAADQLPRFTGEITDVQVDPVRQTQTLTGAGRWARYARLPVDATGWPIEADGARIARVIAAILPDELGTIDPGTMLLLDPDDDTGQQSADQAAAVVTDSSAGQLVEQPTGRLDWHDANHRRAQPIAVTLDAANVLNEFTWTQRVASLVNRVDVTYGRPAATRTVVDPVSVAARGPYPGSGLSTLVTTEAGAELLGALHVGRYSQPVWQLPTVTVDLARSVSTEQLAALLALRHGDKLTLTNLPPGGPYTTADLYVEGIQETALPRAWRLTIAVSDPTAAGSPVRWIDAPPALTWDQVAPALRWVDLVRITNPNDLD